MEMGVCGAARVKNLTALQETKREECWGSASVGARVVGVAGFAIEKPENQWS